MLYERVQDWREAQRELKDQGYTIKAAGRKLDEARSVAGASGGFMADLQGLLSQAGVDEDTRDDVYQLSLRTLPDLSVRKHQIHRKATKGYSNDALRASRPTCSTDRSRWPAFAGRTKWRRPCWP